MPAAAPRTARRGSLREIVDDHPATIVFDHPGLPLPQLSGARIDPGARVTVSTYNLQPHLFQLLEWAAEHSLLQFRGSAVGERSYRVVGKSWVLVRPGARNAVITAPG